MNSEPNTTPQRPSWPDMQGASPNVAGLASALALSAVVAELREGLRAHDIRAREVTSRAGRRGGPVIDVRGMPLGDAAVLAVVLNESASGAGPSSHG